MQDYYKPLAIAGIIFLIFAGAVFGVFYSMRNLARLHDEHDSLENHRIALQSDIRTLIEQNKILSTLYGDNVINIKAVNSVNGLVDFYSQIQKIFSDNDIDIISTRQQDNSIIMNIQGDYYAFMKTLAELKSMPTASKISHIAIRRNTVHHDLIAADLTLETLMINQ